MMMSNGLRPFRSDASPSSTVMFAILFRAILSRELFTHQSSISIAVTGSAPLMLARIARIDVPHPISSTDLPFRSASSSSPRIELVVS